MTACDSGVRVNGSKSLVVVGESIIVSLSLTAMDSDSDSFEEEPTTEVSGLWIDPVTKINGAFLKSMPKSFSGTVRMLASRVLEKVNTEYSLEPPLQPADMIVEPLIRNTLPALLSFLLNVFITEANNRDDIHGIAGIDDKGLRVLIKPKIPAAMRIKTRFKALQETERQASEFISGEVSDNERMITPLSIYLVSLMYSKTTAEGRRLDLVNLLIGLRNDMDDQKAKVDDLTSSNTKLASKVDDLTSSNAKLASSNTELVSSNTELTSKVNRLTSSNAKLVSSNTELTSKVNHLTSSNSELASSNVELASSNANLLEKVNKLEGGSREMSSTLQSVSLRFRLATDVATHLTCSSLQHSRRIHALNRRVVLDDARVKIANVCKCSLDEIRPRKFDVDPLVREVQSMLKNQTEQLSYPALTMIFDNSEDSMRNGGNKAAHEVSLTDREDSVLEASLTNKERVLLGEIYYFAHNKAPDFERGT